MFYSMEGNPYLILKRIIHILFLLFFCAGLKAQDPQFTQFYANPLYLAPSFAGATQQHRLVTNYRNQWPSIPGAFQTYSFSYDHYFENFNSGIGIIAMRDVAGSANLSLTNVGIAYSYDFLVTNLLHIRPGLQFSYVMSGLDFSKLIFSSPTEIPPVESTGDIDASSSVLVYTERYWGGFSVDHMLTPNQSFYADKALIPVKFSVFGGAQIIKQGRLLKPVDETVTLAFLFRSQANYKQLDMGLYWNKQPLVLGLWYRGIPPFNGPRGDALALLVGYKKHQLSIGYSYDFTVSNLITSTGGAHEVSLVYQFRTKARKKLHAVPCPEF
jgi:type IX secretion system PorP/SprF family membrane protein